MQRYYAGSCTSAVNRDIGRVDSSSLPTNFPTNTRRTSQLTPYKLKCDKEPLNARLGPPDFQPQTPNCPEETLTREYVQSGYRETVDGLEEAREIVLTGPNFTKADVVNCKEAIKKRLRAINESRVQKRKAGQVYGVALSGSQLTKPGVFPEQRPCGEDFRKKWLEGLSQQHKRLGSLADHVPHGYRKKFLLEVLVRNNVPLLRATWFIKVTYLNQIRPVSSNLSSGAADKTQLSRSELWTKDIIDYLQSLLDELFSKNNSPSTTHNRDRSPQMSYSGSLQHRTDPMLALSDGEEPSLHFKWWYMVRLLQWHHAEGLLTPSLIIDWVLNQLQEKELLEILQLLLPIIYGFLEIVILSQSYVRGLVGIVLRVIRDPAPGGSDLVDNSRRAYSTSVLVEMLRYLILAVPDTFVSLDCFPLPSSVSSHAINEGNFMTKAIEGMGKGKSSSEEVACMFRSKRVDAHYQSIVFNHAVSSIQRRAGDLAKAASHGYPGHSVPKAAQALDESLYLGDVRRAYKCLFEDISDGALYEGWILRVSPCLRSSLMCLAGVDVSLVHSVFFICEWATCEFRDFRASCPCDLKLTGRKDFSQVYIAIRLLKMKMRDLQAPFRQKNGSTCGTSNILNSEQQSGSILVRNTCKVKCNRKAMDGGSGYLDLSESPCTLHDIIVCWIDQHAIHNNEGLERVYLLIVELICAGIFRPLLYVRHLIVSGIIDLTGNFDQDRGKRHYRVLKQIPATYLRYALDEAGITGGVQLDEALRVYSNERRLVLNSFNSDLPNRSGDFNVPAMKRKHASISGKDTVSRIAGDLGKNSLPSTVTMSTKKAKNVADIEEIKVAISILLQLPHSSSLTPFVVVDESQGSFKRANGSLYNKVELVEATPGCEECRKAKKQKLSDERNPYVQGISPVLSDDGETWWVKKGTKFSETMKVDQPLKPTKQATKSRQKVVRKTQSLAQLADARIEGSQGASTSHVCDNKVSCPHHRTDGDMHKPVDAPLPSSSGDIVSIGKALKKLRCVEKRAIAIWLTNVVRQQIEETEKTLGKVGQFGRSSTVVDDRSARWKLCEDELSALLYMMDVSNDLISAIKFLLWLLPKVPSSPSSTIHSGRNILMLPRNMEGQVCEVGEAFLLSSLRRYENILAVTDLIPDVLSATMQRVAAIVASNGRVSGSTSLIFARYLLKKYGNITSVVAWEKKFRSMNDKRLSSELEFGRSADGELGYPLGVPAGIEDPDDFFRQKISNGRLPRVGYGMRDIVQKNVDDALHYLFGKDRKFLVGNAPKGSPVEKWDNGYQIAQQMVMSLIDCIKQTGGAAQEGDPTLVSSAVSAIVSNVGPTLAKLPDFPMSTSHSTSVLSTGSPSFAKCMLRLYITCLCLLKEALGERQSRVFEIALATEASNALSVAFTPGKASRTHYQMSPEAHDTNTNSSNDLLSTSAKVGSRATKVAAAVSALVVGVVIYGVVSLERMVTVLRLKEGLDIMQFIRNARSNSNGNVRSVVGFKADGLVEVYVHWFRLLVGNCRTVCEGLVVDLLGEPSVVGLSRMKRMLPLGLVFPPAYSIFALVIWWPLILNTNYTIREDVNQLFPCLTTAISDALRHLPFRDVCLRDTQGLYDSMAADSSDAEFANLLELNGSDVRVKSMAFVPLRARLFLNALIDCRMPQSMFKQEDGNRTSAHGESRFHYAENDSKLQDKLVYVLDTLQPAKFHWQWVELRLLLNEQALIEKLEMHDMSLANAIQSSSPSSEKAAASENENNFIQIILTRLLVRPDAAPLFSELVHLFGKSLEDSMLLQAKWFLGGHDVLLGRKTIRQRLTNIAESKGLPIKAHFWEPWGWCGSAIDLLPSKADKRKMDATSLEEGEVVEEGIDLKRNGKGVNHQSDSEYLSLGEQHVTERSFLELVLPCIDQSSDESRNTFASDLIKQLNNIEQQMSAVTRGAGKTAGNASPGTEGQTSKVNNRKAMRGGCPGIARRSTGTESMPPSPAALRASMALRLQLLIRFLPILCADGEPLMRNMRSTLTSVILRLLGNRVVHEDADITLSSIQCFQSKREMESPPEGVPGVFADSTDSLFDRLLLVLHALLSSSRPSWLKSKLSSRMTNGSNKDCPIFDRELVENLQNELGRMQLPDGIRWRIQTAMPVLLSTVRCSLSCQPPSVPSCALASLQPSISIPILNPSQKNMLPLVRTAANISGKLKQQENDMEVDPWTLLEDGTGSGPSSSNTSAVGAGDHAVPRACSWLKGTVRVRRTDLTYVGAVDDGN